MLRTPEQIIAEAARKHAELMARIGPVLHRYSQPGRSR